MRRFFEALMALCLLWSGCAVAAQVPQLRPSLEHPVDVELDSCMAKDPSTAGTIRCADHASRAWAGIVESAGETIRKGLDANGVRAFDMARGAWERFSDGERELRESLYGGLLSTAGSMWRVAGALCVVSFVRERAMDLEGAETLRTLVLQTLDGEKTRFASTDAALNREYRALRDVLGSSERQALLLAQREWIRYRDAETAFRSEYAGRRDEAFRTRQLAILTESRVRQLRLYLDDLRDSGVVGTSGAQANERSKTRCGVRR